MGHLQGDSITSQYFISQLRDWHVDFRHMNLYTFLKPQIFMRKIDDDTVLYNNTDQYPPNDLHPTFTIFAISVIYTHIYLVFFFK